MKMATREIDDADDKAHGGGSDGRSSNAAVCLCVSRQLRKYMGP